MKWKTCLFAFIFCVGVFLFGTLKGQTTSEEGYEIYPAVPLDGSNVFSRVMVPVNQTKTYAWIATDVNSVVELGDDTDLPENVTVTTVGNKVVVTITEDAFGEHSTVISLEASKKDLLSNWTGKKPKRRQVGLIVWYGYSSEDVPLIYGSGDVMIPMEDGSL